MGGGIDSRDCAGLAEECAEDNVFRGDLRSILAFLAAGAELIPHADFGKAAVLRIGKPDGIGSVAFERGLWPRRHGEFHRAGERPQLDADVVSGYSSDNTRRAALLPIGAVGGLFLSDIGGGNDNNATGFGGIGSAKRDQDSIADRHVGSINGFCFGEVSLAWRYSL